MTTIPTDPASASQLRQLIPPADVVRVQFTAPVLDPVRAAEERLLAEKMGKPRAAKRPKDQSGKNLITRRGDRYYANFTSPFDGRRVREALCPPGQKQGTVDPIEAARLAQALWLDEYDKAERRKMGVDVNPDMTVQRVIEDYLDDLLKRVKREVVGVAHARQTKNNLQRMLEQT